MGSAGGRDRRLPGRPATGPAHTRDSCRGGRQGPDEDGAGAARGRTPARGRPRDAVERRAGWQRVSLTIGVGLGVEALPAAPVVAQ